MQSTEQWKPAPGYEGIYEVSDLGNVRSLDRTIMHSRNGLTFLAGRVLKQATHRQGYKLVSLHGRNGKRTHKVHRLVAIAFLATPTNGTDVCHNNSDPADNRASNLRWDTRSGNMLDAVQLGRNPSQRKATCPRGHNLVMPNLRRHEWETKGRRLCYACARENDRARKNRRPFSDAAADETYRRRMAEHG